MNKDTWLVVSLISSLLLVVLLWLFGTEAFATCFKTSNNKTLSDVFSPIATLFTGITIALLFNNWLLQKNELKETREELKIQNFENSFYNLFNFFKDFISKSEIYYEEKLLYKGSSCYHHLFYSVLDDIKNDQQINIEQLKLENIESTEHFNNLINRLNFIFYKNIENENQILRRFFNISESLLSTIYDSHFEDTFKERYVNILKSLLTKDQIYLIFYYSVTLHSNNSFTNLLRNLKFFNNNDFAKFFDDHQINLKIEKLFKTVAYRKGLLSN